MSALYFTVSVSFLFSVTHSFLLFYSFILPYFLALTYSSPVQVDAHSFKAGPRRVSCYCSVYFQIMYFSAFLSFVFASIVPIPIPLSPFSSTTRWVPVVCEGTRLLRHLSSSCFSSLLPDALVHVFSLHLSPCLCGLLISFHIFSSV